MNSRLQTIAVLLRQIIKKYSLPRGKKNQFKKHLRIIREARYTTNSMIDLEYLVYRVIKTIKARIKKENEPLEKLEELYEKVKNPENWCL